MAPTNQTVETEVAMLPLSTLQREVWIDQALHPDIPHYNTGAYSRIDGPIDVSLFRRALEYVVNRHDALRIILVAGDALPLQKVLPRITPELTCLDFSLHEEADARARDWIRKKAQEPFILLETPLFRFALLKVSDERYYWLTQYHHLIVDGWTGTFLVQEVADVYNVLLAGDEPAAPQIPSYMDFVSDDDAYRRSESFHADEAYWKNAFSTLPEPLFHRRHDVASNEVFRAHQADFYLDANLCEDLRAFTVEHNCPLSQVLLSALYGYFACSMQRDEIAFGLFSRNRQKKFEQTAGLFVTTYPVRYRLGRNSKFLDLLGAVGEEARRGAAHRRFPMSDLMRTIGLLGTDRARPFDITVSFLFRQCSAKFGTAPVQFLTLSNGFHPQGLVFYIEDMHAPGRIRLLLDGNQAMFSRLELEQIAARVECFLAAAIRNAHSPISHLPLMPEAERRQVLSLSSGKAVTSVEHRCVHEWIAARVAMTPHAIALEFADKTLTYAELDARANHWARQLRAHGVKPEVFVGSFLRRSPEMIIAMLAIWKAGGAYVPLDPEIPSERMAAMMSTLPTSVILTQSAMRDQLPPGSFVALCMDEDERDGNELLDSAPKCDVCLDNAAYVIFTSGSTGLPKVVVATHANLTHLALRLVDLLALRSEDRILQFTASSWDTSFEEIVPCLVVGARLVLRTPEMVDPIAFFRECYERRICVVDLPTAYFHELVHLVAHGGISWPDSIHTVIVGGEAARFDRFAEFLALAPPRVRLFNTFGLTEATAVSTAIPINEATGRISIGMPLPNVNTYLLNECGEPVPFDCVGEMFVSGAGITRGYFGRPSLTAERFVPDPFSPIPGARMYRTGDLAERSNDGKLFFHGRADQQIKIRGMRVDPGEIEAVLAKMPGIREALVDLRAAPNQEPHLVGYVITDPDKSLIADEILYYARQQLPTYMIPSALVFVDQWPRLSTGKIDRRRLPEPASLSESYHEAPRDSLEEVVAQAFADVLGALQIGRSDNFFQLGGHSLLAMRLMSTLQKRLGLAPPMAAVFRHPVVHTLAAFLKDQLGQTHFLRPEARHFNEPAYEGLSSLERRLWFLERLHPDSRAYQAPQGIKVSGSLDLDLLQSSLHALAMRHEILRTTYADRDGEPIRCVSTTVDIPIRTVDLSRAHDKTRALRQTIAEELAIPFALARGPLTRLVVLQISANEHILLLNQHHIITDEWSGGVLLREWFALYESRRKGETDALPPLPYQYAEFARAEQRALAGDYFTASRRYWKEHLRDVPGLTLPWLGPTAPPGPAAHISFRLDAKTSQALRAFARTHGITAFMVWYGAFLVLCSRLSGQTDFALGSVAANRDAEAVGGLLGLFTNRFILRTDLAGDPTFIEIVQRARATAMDAYRHQAVPFDVVVQDLGIVRRPGEMPLYDVSFFQVTLPDALVDANWSTFFDVLPDGVTTAKNALSIVITENNDASIVHLTYDTTRIHVHQAQRILNYWRVVIAELLEHPTKRLSEINILPPGEHAAFHAENSGALAYRRDVGIHELFETQVEHQPEAIAVHCDNANLSYRELNQRANGLAHQLRHMGVGPEVLVGLCVQRSLDMVVGLLAILKAGGAYVPLDPSWPRERIARIIEDAAMPVILTLSALEDRLPPESTRIVLDIRNQFEESNNPLSPNTAGDHAAYVLFTSGSTGKPKGVIVEHRQIVEYVLGIAERFGFDTPLRYGLVSTFAADLGNTALFPALALGGTLHIVSEAAAMNPTELAEEFEKHPVDVLKMTPSHLTALLTANRPERLLPRKRLVLGGEPTRWELIDTVRRLAPSCVITNHYGPTETTIGVLTLDVQTDMPRGHSIGPALGTTRPNVRAYVLDAHLSPVPAGVVGELYIGGLAVTRGYLTQPGLTADRFVPDPFAFDLGSRMYRTGDRVRCNEDNLLEFLGRADGQVKIRGYRIELGEIEAALSTHESVRACVVLAREDVSDDKRLIAYVVGDEEQGSRDMLSAHLRKTLPEYMIPQTFLYLPTLPLTPNGKVDRRTLPIPEFNDRNGQTNIAPRNNLEETVVRIWEKLLNVKTIGIADDFFSLGGHSLLAVRCLALIEKQLGIALPVAAIFEHPTAESLAKLLANTSYHEQTSIRLPLLPRHDESAFAGLFSTERRLWFLQRLYPQSLSYQVPILWRLHGEFNLAALQASVDALVERHEILRTIYPERNGSPERRVLAQCSILIRYIDVTLVPEETRKSSVEKIIRDELAIPFHIEQEPPTRVTCIRESTENHLVLWLWHHILTDEWSNGILKRELSVCYERLRNCEPLNLLTLPYHFADIARAENTAIEEDRWAGSRAYWKEKLGGMPRISLPFLRPSGGNNPGSEGRCKLRVSAELALAVASLGHRHGCTPFMVWYALFATLLSRYTQEIDFGIGTVVANRDTPGTEELLGFFTNTIVLRMDISQDPTVHELLDQARRTTVEAFRHQAIPFDIVVQDQGRVWRDRESSPIEVSIFEVSASKQAGSEFRFVEIGDEFDPVLQGLTTAKDPLSLAIEHVEDGVILCAFFDTTRVDCPAVERMLGHLRTLAGDAVIFPEKRLSELSYLSANEIATFQRWNDTAAPYPAADCMHTLFARQVAKTPDAWAIFYDRERLSYRELDVRAEELARHLQFLGVKPDVLVGLYVDRSVDMIVAMLGIMKAGGAYVPIDPAWPEQRLQFVLDDTRTPIIVTPARLASRLQTQRSTRLVCIDELPPLPIDATNEITSDVAPNHLAYVVYTSGSTGEPKGVMIEHHSLVAHVSAYIQFHGLTADSRVLALTPPYFDASVEQIFPALACGGCVVVADWDFDPQSFSEKLIQYGVTLLDTTGAHWRALVDHWVEAPHVAERLCLRTMMVGGDVMPAEVLSRWRKSELSKRTRLVNVYGPTETTVAATAYEVTVDFDIQAPRIPIGKPYANRTAFVLDKQLGPVPVGVPGELFIGGIGPARGYWNQPDLTAERYFDLAALPTVGALLPAMGQGKVYRTGDLCQWLPDGSLDFLGRADNQIKIRGYRVDLGEIEAHLRRLPGIDDAAVVIRDQGLHRSLVAYVAADDVEEGPLQQILADSLRQTLPEHMIPAHFIALSKIPRSTTTGKVDRTRLPDPSPGIRGERTAPRTETEKKLAEIYKDLLKCDSIVAEDDFFELGGHSLLATQLVSRIHRLFAVKVPLSSVFQQRTINALATLIDALSSHQGAKSVQSGIPLVPRDKPLPLSFGQERLWFLDRMGMGGAFHVPLSMRIEGPLEIEALQWSLSEIIRRHESLRSTFVMVDDEPRQVIQAPRQFALPVVDMRHLSANEQESEVSHCILAEVRRPFDLTNDLLLRGSLLWLSDEPIPSYVLLATMHHIASDGWSLDIFASELETLYACHRQNDPSPLSELSVQMPDVAIWQRARLTVEATVQLMDYWRSHLDGAPFHLAWPWDRISASERNRGTWSFRIDEALTAGLQDLTKKAGATLFTTLLVAFQVLLGRLTNADDIIVGTPFHGRSREEFENLIGFFVNNLPLRAEFSDDPPFFNLLKRMQIMVREALEHGDLPFEKMVECFSSERDSTRHPIFQAVLAFHEKPARPLTLPELHITPMEVMPAQARLDVELHVEPRAAGLDAFFYYDATIFNDASIRTLADRFVLLLRSIAKAPQTRVHAFPLLLPHEQQNLFVEWNNTAVEFREDLCAHELIAAQAQRTPDVMAVLFDDGTAQSSLTYRELISRANRLAHHLSALGVGPEKLVGLSLKPSPEVIVALLATLIAGGAYLPLDATYPKQRLEHMLQDARPNVIITNEEWLESIAMPAAQFVCLDRDADVIATMPDTAPVTNVCPDNLAYVIYTSGSTGKPKGVLVRHRGLVNVARAQREQFKLKPGDRVLQWASLNFDSAVAEIWMTLATGATLCVGTREQVLPGEPLIDFLARNEISMVTLTPSALASLPKAALPKLHTLAVAGEACLPRIVENWASGRRFLNLYGPTEATIWSTAMHCEDPTDAAVIGRPIQNCCVYVLDRHYEPVPLGTPGELFIAGLGVARGYLQRPALTAERFLPNPFGEGRLYRTGDLVRWRSNGQLEFLGRTDRQIKLRGYRIELGEVESRLAEHSNLHETVVTLIDDKLIGPCLIAYIVPREYDENLVSNLREHLRAQLPEYMVPSLWMVLDGLPRSPNGKVDRNALPTPEAKLVPDEHALSATENMLAKIWRDVLGLASVGRMQSFFELGGHSLLVAKVAARVERTFALDFPLPTFFRHTTIAALAKWIDSQPRGANDLPVLQAVPHDKPLPLSLVQERMWRLHDGSRYTIPLALQLSGPLDIDCLERSFREIVRRQQVFRTNIVMVDERPMQIVRDTEFRIEITDLRDIADERQASVLVDLALKETRRTFDLTKDALFLVHLLRLAGQTEHALIVNMHHITVDAGSIEVLLNELAVLYNAYRAGLLSPLSELPIQYADFAVWQRARFTPERLEEQLAYWRNKLEHIPYALGSLIPEPRPTNFSAAGRKASRTLDPQLASRIRKMTSDLNMTLFMTMLAGFEIALAGLSGQKDIVVTTSTTHRSHVELEGVCGCFLHILPIRVNISESHSFFDLAHQVRDVMIESLPYLDITATRLEAALFPERDLKREPVFQISFNTVPNLYPSGGLTDITMSELPIPGDELAKYDLAVYVADSGNEIEIRTLFRGELLSTQTMDRLLDGFLQVLVRVIDDPQQELNALCLSS